MHHLATYHARLLLLSTLLFVFISVAIAAQETSAIKLSVSDLLVDSVQPVVDEFEQQTGIRVELVPYNGFGPPLNPSNDIDDYLDKAEEYFSSADVVVVSENTTPELTRAGYLLNLEPLVQSDLSFNAADFYDSMLRAFEWDRGLWALPLSANYIVMTYRPDAFDEAGLTYPTGSWSLSDVGNAARTLIKRDANGNVTTPGLLTFGFGNEVGALMISLLSTPAFDTTVFPSEPQLANPQLAELMAQWLELGKDHLFDFPTSGNVDAMPFQLGQGIIFDILREDGEEQIEKQASLLPGGQAGLLVSGYGISSGSQNPDAAYELIKFLINSPTIVNTSFGAQPARRIVDGAENEDEIGGSFFSGMRLPPEIETIKEELLANAMTNSDLLFSDSITRAYELMESDNLDAESALLRAQTEREKRLQRAVERGQETQVVVERPAEALQLAEGEISLRFANVSFVSTLPNQDLWDTVAQEFAAQDPQVGQVSIKAESPGVSLDNFTEKFDCFYSTLNYIDDENLGQFLNIDPLIASDPTYDPNDFVNGTLAQVQINDQIWALPITLIPSIIRYNNDLFNQAGVTPPQGTWTVSEFEDALRSLKNVLPQDKASFQPSLFDNGYILSLIAAYGGLPVDPRTRPETLNFTEPETVAAIRQVLDLAKEGLIDYSSLSGLEQFSFLHDDTSERVPMYTETLSPFDTSSIIIGGETDEGMPSLPNTDGIVSYPRGTRYSIVPLDLGSAYISAKTLHAEPCYRFINYIAQRSELFETMPARRSIMNNPNFVATQEPNRLEMFRTIDQMLQEPDALMVPVNIAEDSFDKTLWLFEVFDRYVKDEVNDLEADLAQAQQFTNEFTTCVGNITLETASVDDLNEYFDQIKTCATDIDPNAGRFFP